MPFDALITIDIIYIMEEFLDQCRPPVEIRDKVDIAYKIENHSVIIYEIRPRWNNEKEMIESNIAKCTFVKKENHWKVFWYKSDMKWHAYKPFPTVLNLNQFLTIVINDKHACFWG